MEMHHQSDPVSRCENTCSCELCRIRPGQAAQHRAACPGSLWCRQTKAPLSCLFQPLSPFPTWAQSLFWGEGVPPHCWTLLPAFSAAPSPPPSEWLVFS